MNYRDIASGFVEAALWSSANPDYCGDDDAPEFLDGVDAGLAPGQEFRLGLVATRWARDNRKLAEQGIEALENSQHTGEELLGHNLWLTAHSHGVGFWDRGLGDLGDDLTKAAQKLRERNGYVGDDGHVYFD